MKSSRDFDEFASHSFSVGGRITFETAGDISRTSIQRNGRLGADVHLKKTYRTPQKGVKYPRGGKDGKM